jgi:predicted dehydrogenase
MPGELKIGIIGTGQIGKQHLKKWQEVPGVRILAVCDIDEAEARRVAAEYKVPRVLKDFRDLLALKGIVAVDVCLHNNLHAPVSTAALEAGKHVYCEKPLAGSYVDAQRMVEAADKTGRKLHMQLATLYSMETRAAKRFVDDGNLGRIYYAKSSSYRRRGRPYVDGYGTPRFVQKAIAAGGALYDMGVYHIGQVLYLLDNPAVKTISGATYQKTAMYEDRRKKGKYDVEELGIGLARLGGGVTFFIEEAWAIHLGGTDGSKIAGTRGGLTLGPPLAFHTTESDLELNATLDLAAAEYRWGKCIPHSDAYKHSQDHWAAALRGEVPLLPTARIGLATMLISEGIYLSQKLGREVTPEEVMQHSVSTALKL